MGHVDLPRLGADGEVEGPSLSMNEQIGETMANTESMALFMPQSLLHC